MLGVGDLRASPEYVKACLCRSGEHRLRYSRALLELIKADRLAGSQLRCTDNDLN